MRCVPVTTMRRMVRMAGAAGAGAAAVAGGGAVPAPGTAGCAKTGATAIAKLRQSDVVRSKPFFRATIRMGVRQTRLWLRAKPMGSEKIQAGYVIPSRQEHQSQHKHQPKPKSSILDAPPKRAPQNCFACIV